MLDIFNNDAFSEVSLTESIMKQPVKYGRLARHFTHKGIRTTTAVIEEKHGKLQLVTSAARGSTPKGKTRNTREARSFVVPHLPHDAPILAADVQDVRSFGSEGQLESVAEVVDEVLQGLREDHELTWEYMRAGAIQGVVKDGDTTSTIYDFFTEFGVSETTVTMTTASNDFRLKCAEIDRAVEDALGATPYSGLRAYCGDQFWDAFIDHTEVKDAYERWQDGKWERDDPQTAFELWGIKWEQYRAKLGSDYFIPRTDCRIVPEGTRMFQHISAPADFMSAVNTKGKMLYTKKEMMPLDKGVYLHSQSNPLFIPTRPKALIKVQIA